MGMPVVNWGSRIGPMTMLSPTLPSPNIQTFSSSFFKHQVNRNHVRRAITRRAKEARYRGKD
jgi:hypothetical protein